uniref:15-hydroxyprostaglandin dehydrogenase [NAD(+)] n=1 Tax=Photinus pyralis TaxID=7054 RepID=A0A1Y1N6G0_PHOPY
MFDVTGKVALVTGGVRGIGLSIVKELLRNGAKAVAILDINNVSGEKVVREIHDEFGDGKAMFLKVDVKSRAQMEDAFRKTIATFANLDIVVNNAGVCLDLNWEEEIGVNLVGTTNGTVLAFEKYLPNSRSGHEGVILNMSSIGSFTLYPVIPIYGATKSGVAHLTRTFGQEVHYERKKVRVIALCPNRTDTEMVVWNDAAFLNPEYAELQRQIDMDEQPVGQSADHVAKAAVRMIREGKNGSLWAIEDSKPPYEVEIIFSKKEIEKPM